MYLGVIRSMPTAYSTVTIQHNHLNRKNITQNQKYECRNTRAVQWKTGKVVLKIACKTDVTVCRVCEGGDLELPIDGVGMPATHIGTWETVRQDGGALATVHQPRAAKCCEIFV